MVLKLKKLYLCLCAVCVACLCTPTNALASTFNSAHINYLGGYVSKLGFSDDYLLFCPSSEESILLIGEIKNDGEVFTFENCRKYVCSTVNGVFSFNSFDDISGSVDISDLYAFSSCGDLPILDVGGVMYEKLSLFVIIVGSLFVFLIVSLGIWRK